MNFPGPALGIVFDIDGLGGGFYGRAAWSLFMKNIDPKRLGACLLVDGDTAATLDGEANEYCIGIFGLHDPEYVRGVFEELDDPGLAPVHRRFIEKIALDRQPLPIVGLVHFGRLTTDEWSSYHHHLCRDNGWGYAPRAVPDDLDAEQRAELGELARPRI